MATDVEWGSLLELLLASDRVWIKKLSRNDCSWADNRKKLHQSGFYVPKSIRESGFFPALANVNTAKAHIFETSIATEWSGSGAQRLSRLVHYSNKSSEAHFTRVPAEEFAGLNPASLLVCGPKPGQSRHRMYWLAILDSASQSASLIETLFDLPATFHSEVFSPEDFLRASPAPTEGLIWDLQAALRNGTLEQFIKGAEQLPAPEYLASMAQDEYLSKRGISSLNPLDLRAPGDAVMEISRDIEYRLYREAEIRHRAADVLRILTTQSATDLPSAVVHGFPALTASFLSASQHRKSRAGRSFENHIHRLLRDAGVNFSAQVVTGGRRPDFVIPKDAMLSGSAAHGSIVLSAKTTLRERWKQLGLERFDSQLFLATVDDRITGDAIDDMHRHNITLVVPESLKQSKEACYDEKSNVISFKQFFEEEIRLKRPWALNGGQSGEL